jgi:hypothetical protein
MQKAPACSQATLFDHDVFGIIQSPMLDVVSSHKVMHQTQHLLMLPLAT